MGVLVLAKDGIEVEIPLLCAPAVDQVRMYARPDTALLLQQDVSGGVTRA